MSMPEQNISVKISGTPVRKGAFIPIVNINEAFFEISDSYPAIMSRDACVYTLSVQSDITVYKLIFNRMRHHGDGADARLVIGFSIPAGYMLPEGIDATGVLHTLLEAFIGSFALALPDGTFEYRFGRLDTGALENIWKSIVLVPAEDHRVLMKDDAPRGAIEVSGDRIATTLSCMDREEYADISELIVAEHINTSVGGIGMVLKDENPIQEYGGADISDDEGVSAPETLDTAPLESGTGLTADPGDESGAESGDDLHGTGIRYYGRTEENESSGRRRIWPSLLAGVFLGAVITYLAFRVFDGNPDISPDMPPTEDTSAVVRPLDTVAPAKVETVFIEKKVVVEKVRRQEKTRPRAVTMPPRRQASEAESSASDGERAPAPVYKYDPEAERSL